VSDLAISIRGVSKTFGSTRAVRELHLDVPRGSLCGFLGPNGAGKSTTIRMIMSIIYPDTGTIDVLGSSALDNKDRIGYLPEERGLYRKMRVGEFLEYIAKLKGTSRKGLTQRIKDWLERVELPEGAAIYRRRCQELSKGMQQKVQFIASVIHEPDLLILDEPFSGLDPVNAQVMNRMFTEIHDSGTTIIFSTHVLHQAEMLCDRIFLINHGVKLLDASMDEIHTQFDPRTIVVEPAAAGAAANGAIDFLAIPGVVNSTHDVEENEHELLLAEGTDPQAVMRTIVQTHAIRSIELRRVTLDEVFVRLVMQDEGVAAAAKAREELSHA
jgi:ABC-2 type transport system ATP-binding protein